MLTLARTSRRLLLPAILAIVSIGGCNAGAAPATSDGPSAAPSAPSDSTPADPGADGGSGGSSGSGVVGEVPVGPLPGDPGAGEPTLVRPQPGRLDPHPVSPQRLQASVDGRHVLVKISWYGGVEPCSVLDSVTVERTDRTIALTVIEGSSDLGAICPEIAMLKATIVDLGELEPGVWTITAPKSDATPIQLTIS